LAIKPFFENPYEVLDNYSIDHFYLNDQLSRRFMVKALYLLVFAALGISVQGSSFADAADVRPADPNRALIIEMSIPAPLPEVWKAFTTADGLSSWLAPEVSVDLRKGGDWLVKFPGSTAGGTIVSFVPQKELVLSALAPDRFPHVRAARTRAVFTFTAKGNNTLVRLSQTGWQQGKEWDAAYEYLAAANGQMLAMLHHRYVAGPTDWQK
jgi:uncharacterized protein YndB with AHSA1/START domain